MTRHRFDVLSFAFGLGFTLIGAVFLAGETVRTRELLPVAGPVAAIILGILVVVAARPQRDRSERREEPVLQDGGTAAG